MSTRTTTIRIKVDAKKAILRMVMMKKRANDMRPVLWRAKQWLRFANEENFRQAGLPSGGWSPLDPQYAAWKKLREPGAPTMVASGRLFSSLTALSGPPNVVEMMSATFGTRVEYAKFHQYGTTKMPKRKVVYEPVGFASKFGDVAATYVAHGNIKSVMDSML
jgi:phage gpG-like protein